MTQSLSKVFIAGTGRSGTTILHEIIGSHPAFHLIPYETKFMVEADGLAALIPALSDSFSFSASDLAFLRFMILMGIDVPGMGTAKENIEFGQNLRQLIGPAHYDAPLHEFVAALTDFDYLGYPYPHHFETRADLIALCRKMVSAMFGSAALAAGKQAWVEKTPSNLIAIDLLWEIFPDARIIHIKRDPRGVLHSLMQQDWAPQELEPATRFLRHIYWRWGQLKPRLPLPDPRYCEVKLEDLCTEPDRILSELAAFLQVPDLFPRNRVWPPAADGWRTTMPPDQRAHAERHLADMFPLMGYDI